MSSAPTFALAVAKLNSPLKVRLRSFGPLKAGRVGGELDRSHMPYQVTFSVFST